MSDVQNAVDAPLQFDRVVHADPAAPKALTCAACGGPVESQYYHADGKVLCATCGAARQAAAVPDRRAATLLRALALGFGACLVGALAYWAVMEFLNLEIGLVAIAIGYFVGRAVAMGTKGRSARRHRILAVGLTYLAVGLAYTPFAYRELKDKKTPAASADSVVTVPATAATAAATIDSATKAATAEGAAPATTPAATPAKAKEAPTVRGFVIALAALFGLVLALPVFGALSSGASGILSVLIIGFGMRQAWRIAAASNTTVTGPLPVSGAPAA